MAGRAGRIGFMMSLSNHSVLKLFTGLATAAFIAWKLMVNRAILKAMDAVITNTIQPIFVRYAKSCNHLFMANHAIGEAMTIAMSTSFRNSLDNNVTILEMLAPSTFLTPISLVRCSALKVARPNNPKQEIRIAIMVKYPTMADRRFSAS